MSFTLSFPGHKSAEPHTGLIEEHEVYDVVLDETRQSIEDMGSDGYDLIWAFPCDLDTNGDGDCPRCFQRGECIQPTKEGDLDRFTPEVQERLTMEAHERGIAASVTRHAPQIFKDLWVRYRAGEGDIAIDNTTYATLPDGTKVALTEVQDD